MKKWAFTCIACMYLLMLYNINCAYSNDMKIVCSKDVQCNSEEWTFKKRFLESLFKFLCSYFVLKVLIMDWPYMCYLNAIKMELM